MQPPEPLVFADDGAFPNSRLPALLYRGAIVTGRDLGPAFETLFGRNGWTGSWRNGLYSFHHYHSTAHEVLGIHRGNVKVLLGGEKGRVITLTAGDVVVIPAGVAHRNVESSSDYGVVGAYPTGTSPDVQYGKPGERPGTDRTISSLDIPSLDPVGGASGSLASLWSKAR
jgi:uncharacterized protein YjlB